MKAGWTKTVLGQAVDFQRGLTYSKADEVDFSANAVLRANNIDLLTRSLDLTDIRYISEKVAISNTVRVKPGSCIMCTASGSKSHLGKVAYIDEDYGYAFGGFMAQLTPRNGLEPRFLFHILTGPSFALWLEGVSSGVNINNLKRSDIADFPIDLPPLEEQRRIAAVLDEAFAGIATATANAQKNLIGARALFDTELTAIFNTPSDGWTVKSMDEVAILSRGQNPPKSKFSYSPKEGYVRFYQIRDGKSEANAVYVPDSPQLHRVEKDDILMVAYRHVGRVFRGVSGAFNVALCKIQNRNRNIVLDDYLFHLLPTDLVRGELLKRAERSLIPSMSVHHLKEIMVPVPPIEIQHDIVVRINLLEKACGELEDVYSQKLAGLTELKQCLLQKAFAGELT